LRQSGRDRFALKDMLRFALKDLLRGATTPLRVYWDVKKLLDESSFFVDKREILICRGDVTSQSLPQAAKLPIQGVRSHALGRKVARRAAP